MSPSKKCQVRARVNPNAEQRQGRLNNETGLTVWFGNRQVARDGSVMG